MSNIGWKDILTDEMPVELAHEIDIFEGQMELMGQGKLDEKVFAETRLRRGVYGQRYDNGQRHDGFESKELDFHDKDRFKGPDTLWHAPGMMRIKVPGGGLTPDQLDVLAQVADEYSGGVLHITTRQDIQLHFVHIEDTQDLMRRLASVGITTREACGNSVRNVTCCHLSGVCRTEVFDATPYSEAFAQFLLGHDDVQDFGRKFKPAFSGCESEACGLVMMHDMGYLAQIKEVDGKPKRGFKVFVRRRPWHGAASGQSVERIHSGRGNASTGPGSCPRLCQVGRKRNRNRARIKFLVAKLGIEEFTRLVEEERKTLPHDDRWTAYLDTLPQYEEKPAKPPTFLNGQVRSDEFNQWFETNVYSQRQEGYSVVTVNLPLGDLTSQQTWDLADIARKICGRQCARDR